MKLFPYSGQQTHAFVHTRGEAVQVILPVLEGRPVLRIATPTDVDLGVPVNREQLTQQLALTRTGRPGDQVMDCAPVGPVIPVQRWSVIDVQADVCDAADRVEGGIDAWPVRMSSSGYRSYAFSEARLALPEGC